MSGQAAKWREEQILIICPGSKTTLAQLGCGELTVPGLRIPTRMFKDNESGDYRPYFVEKRKKASKEGTNGTGIAKEADEYEYIEDPDATEGAIYPIRAGHIVEMEAFLAFLDHVHSMLTTTYHNTPIMLMASPQWTRRNCETIVRYIFEKTKTPALCLIHSGVATQYGLKHPHMTVVDIGFEKVDVTCIYDSRVVSHREVGEHLDGAPGETVSGGEVFTQKLLDLLKEKDFNYDMAEQLKKSNICEVLPYVPDEPLLMELPQESAAVVAATSVAAAAPAPSAVLQAAQEPPSVVEPVRPPIVTMTDIDDDGAAGEDKAVDEDGVLDVASILTSGQTKEFLAKKEREKAEKSKGRKGAKGQEAEPAGAKQVRLPNSKRKRNTFHYEELAREEALPLPPAEVKDDSAAPNGEADAATAGDGQTNGSQGQDGQNSQSGSAPKPEETPLSFFPPAEPPLPTLSSTERPVKRIRRDIEVGLERFTFAERAEIDRIVGTIYRTVQEIDDMYMRPSCWENIVFVGNGGRLRGLKENIIQTLNARHLISPSTATMFTSELPSNLGTPSGTGSQTPVGNFTTPPHQLGPTSSGVNPLLQAATTASLSLPPRGAAELNAPPGSTSGDVGGATSHHFHSQTPTAIKLAPLPTYLAEWTKNGFEEAMFLGAQVAARLAFCTHNSSDPEAQRLMSLNRVEYNEYGPRAVRTHSMLG